MDFSQYDDILSKGYPSYEELGGFPLGRMLQQLDLLAWTTTARTIKLNRDEPDLPETELEEKLKKENRMLSEERLREVYRQHAKRVMEGINFLTNRDFGRILPDFTAADWAQSPFHEYNGFLREAGTNLMMFLRFVTLYHDIGKAIHRDRHPILGQHLLESISDDDTRKFKSICDEWFFMMTQLIGHHDLFGVLCTGEASRPVLIDALRLQEAEKAISCLVTLNLADIFGTLPKMAPRIMTTVLNDWKFIVNLISQQEPEEGIVYKSSLERQILTQAQEQERTTERVKRLLVTTFYMLKKIPNEEQEILAQSVTSDVVLDALKTRLGPGLRVFCNDFALVCKFDYTLRFFVDLVEAWVDEQKRRSSLKREQKEPSNLKDVDIRGIAAIIVEVFERLVTNYRDLTRHREGWPRRIGIELLGLTRSKQISESVIGFLLSDRRTEGVNWIADEATAWYFI